MYIYIYLNSLLNNILVAGVLVPFIINAATVVVSNCVFPFSTLAHKRMIRPVRSSGKLKPPNSQVATGVVEC